MTLKVVYLYFKMRLSKGQASEQTEATKEWYYFNSRKHLESCAQYLKSTDAVTDGMMVLSET